MDKGIKFDGNILSEFEKQLKEVEKLTGLKHTKHRCTYGSYCNNQQYIFGDLPFDGVDIKNTKIHVYVKNDIHPHCFAVPNDYSYFLINEMDLDVNGSGEYDIEAVRYKDHVRLTIKGKTGTVDYIVALPDSTRYCYISFTGANYHLNVVSITRSDEEIGSGYIPRIAELVSYIDGEAGDVPNVQIDDYRSDATDGVLLTDSMVIDFHAKSLPTARLIWHCPFVCVFSSTNGKVTDEDYREFALVRLDGEVWETGNLAKNEVIVSKNDDFDGWDKWKQLNRDGFDCHVSIKRNGNVVTVITENGGIFVKTTTTIKTDDAKYYVALTGDQCALTKIYFKVNG